MKTKLCPDCLIDKEIIHFEQISINGWRKKCTACRSKTKRVRYPLTYKKGLAAQSAKEKLNRQKNPHIYIIKDCQNADRKFGRGKNDLDIDFVKDMISGGCSYCGEKEIRIALDRIYNSIGHYKDNVVSACFRCNLLRNSMPYEAWMHIVPAIKEAKELGLFGSWRSKTWQKWDNRESDPS